MNGFYRRAATVVLAGALALAGCQGSKGDAGANGANGAPGGTGPGGPTGPTGPTGPGGIPGLPGVSTGLVVDVLSVSTTSPVTVHFTMKDDRGFAVDTNGVYSVNTVMTPRFALAYTSTDVNGMTLPYTVYTNSGTPAQPTVYNPATAGQGTLVQNAYGDYTYTFPTTTTTGGAVAVALDQTKLDNTHVVWIQVTRQTNLNNADDPKGFTAVDKDFWFVPSGAKAPVKRELVKTDNCSKCHRGFAPGERSITGSTFHGGGRVEAPFCGICHNPGHVSNPAAEAKIYIHRIHNSENLQPANLFHGIQFAFPQDIRNCDACHANTLQGSQAKSNPSRAACGSCHDYVSFTGAGAATCAHPVAKDGTGVNITCNHTGGQRTDDSACTGCHSAQDVTNYHVTVAPPDPGSIRAGGANANTNASFLAATGQAPTGAKRVTYEVKSVDAVAVGPAFQPSITFRFLVDGVATPMQTFSAGVTTEIFSNFVGSPSVYFAFALPQDGILSPADFNASVSGYIKGIWNGSATGTGAGTLTGPDSNQFYTIQLTGVTIPATAKLLTGGVGYSYSLSSTPPLVQTDVPAYPYNVAIPAYPYITAGSFQGGISVPAPNVWKVANGFTGRRPIVDTNKCQTCHVQLGATPTFHAGQRNDAGTCSFCHTPNKTSSGWSAGSKVFIHALHGARVRTQPFTWHATDPLGFSEVEFPGRLNDCTACHYEPPGFVGHTFNFTGAALTKTSGTSTSGTKNGVQCTVAAPCTCGTSANACILTDSGATSFPDRVLDVTVATGTFTIPAPPAVNTISPYVVADGVTNYGAGYAYNAATGATTEAAGTTLVTSKIAAVCSACHDKPLAIDHMQTMGGSFYAPRSAALDPKAPLEQCMLCHGPNTIVDLAVMHIY